MERLDEVAPALEPLLQRMRALKELHTQGALFSQRLRQLEAGQEAVGALLEAKTGTLGEVRAGMAENVALMTRNMEALDARMAALAAKLG
jgi:hypothetical protein